MKAEDKHDTSTEYQMTVSQIRLVSEEAPFGVLPASPSSGSMLTRLSSLDEAGPALWADAVLPLAEDADAASSAFLVLGDCLLADHSSS